MDNWQCTRNESEDITLLFTRRLLSWSCAIRNKRATHTKTNSWSSASLLKAFLSSCFHPTVRSNVLLLSSLLRFDSVARWAKLVMIGRQVCCDLLLKKILFSVWSCEKDVQNSPCLLLMLSGPAVYGSLLITPHYYFKLRLSTEEIVSFTLRLPFNNPEGTCFAPIFLSFRSRTVYTFFVLCLFSRCTWEAPGKWSWRGGSIAPHFYGACTKTSSKLLSCISLAALLWARKCESSLNAVVTKKA